ncbi:uncharacterized protein [Halyomorpha halys]|uniref:uncharacterized protein n=1 Tax=Halyomorpha halys TaxID=286706 RepID=UPI0006D516AA|nr:D-arabinitol dehydrogenase 1-like [Halyomorpha halys]
MEALQFDPQKKVLSLIQHEKPKITSDDELIVEVAYAGLCGTDIHIIGGEFPCSKTPVILGHEFSGIVREAGPGVDHVRVGDKVVIDPQSWCTTCEYCTTARYHLCTNGGVDFATGICLNGGWAKYSKVRARQVYKIPDGLTLKQGALGEPISCVVWGLERGVSDVPVGAKVLITGAGIIGNIWCAILYHLGHRKVTVVEPMEARRIINKGLGTGFECLDPAELKKKYSSEEFDLAIECSGNAAATEQALASLRASGKLCIFGVAAPHSKITISPFEIYKKELTIIGSNINPFSMKKALDLMEAMDKKFLDFEKLGVKEYKLNEYETGLEMLRKGSIAKVMFQVNTKLE